MAISTIENLKNVLGIGARPNLFKVEINFPADLASSFKSIAGDKVDLLCKGAAIPSMTLGVIEVPFRGGRRAKIPGDRTWTDWSATFISDNGHNVRALFVAWTDFIKAMDYDSSTFRNLNITGTKSEVNSSYYANILVKHLKSDGETVSRTYALYDTFPTDVSAIDLSFDSTDTISEFTVTFQYHWMNAFSGNSSGESTASSDMEASEIETKSP